VIAVSGLTLFYCGWALAVVVTVGVIVKLLGSRADVEATSPLWGTDPDDLVWEDEASAAVHSSLASVRAAAQSWGQTITALLGVLGAVAIVKGPDALTDIDGDRATLAVLLIMLAAALAAGAIALAAFAAQGVPHDVTPFDGWALKSLTLSRARSAATQLAWSRVLAVAALLVVIFVAGLTWLTALESDSGAKEHSAVVLRARVATCGTLGSTAGGVLTLAAEGGKPQVIRGASSITIVDACP
jgi:hypothetical protein